MFVGVVDNSMKIKVDTREKEWYSKINSQITTGVAVESCLLAVGDAIICDDNDEVLVILERKTLRDLSASIRDGRYKEQSFRLGECQISRHNVIYVVEGQLGAYQPGTFGLSRTTIMAAVMSLFYSEGYTVFFTQHVQESADWVVALVRKMNGEGPGFYTNLTPVTYESVCQKTKRAQVSVDNIDVVMLSQIPGVSPATARAIVDAGYTLKKLLVAMAEDPAVLKDIYLVTKTDKRRKINKTAMSNLRLYLHL